MNLGDKEPIRSLTIPEALEGISVSLLLPVAWVASEDLAGQVAEAVAATQVVNRQP